MILTYVRAFLVFIGLLKQAESAMEEIAETNKLEAAKANAEATKDTTGIDNLLSQ